MHLPVRSIWLSLNALSIPLTYSCSTSFSHQLKPRLWPPLPTSAQPNNLLAPISPNSVISLQSTPFCHPATTSHSSSSNWLNCVNHILFVFNKIHNLKIKNANLSSPIVCIKIKVLLEEAISGSGNNELPHIVLVNQISLNMMRWSRLQEQERTSQVII